MITDEKTVLNDDRTALDWINNFSGNDDLNKSWENLEEYYKECEKQLFLMEGLSYDNFGAGSKKEIISFLKEKFGLSDDNSQTKDQDFIDDLSRFLKIDEEDMIKLLKTDKESQKIDDIIIKMMRFYNLRLKYIHSIRITYIAKYEVEKLLKGKNLDNYQLISNSVLLSALYHDIGRFYQAIEYNSLNDKMLEDDVNLKNIVTDDIKKIDHAVVGYFLSLVNAISLHNSLEKKDKDHLIMFIQETMAAIVVRYHQISNVKMPQFDDKGDIKEINDINIDENGELSYKLLGPLFKLISDAYKNAVAYEIKVDLDDEQRKYINEFIDNLFRKNKLDDISSGWASNAGVEAIKEGTIEIIVNEVTRPNKRTASEIADDIFEKIQIVIANYKMIEFNDIEKHKIKNDIIVLLNKMLNFDIAKSINIIFENEDIEKLDENAKKARKIAKVFISRCLSITTDADKIDIFNQRAEGKYNVKYKSETYDIFPTKNKSLKEMLKEYYKIDIGNNPIIIDSDMIKILNGLSAAVINGLKDSLFKGLNDLFVSKKNTKGEDIWKFREDVEIYVYDNNIEVKYNNNEIKTYETNSFNRFFNDNYLELVCENCSLKSNDLSDFKEFKKANLYLLQIVVPTEIIEKKIEGTTKEEKLKNQIEICKNIMLSDGIIDRIKYYESNTNGIWVCEAKDSDHIVQHSLTGLLWQINQFLFVNMRNLHSFKLIKNLNLFDKILNKYKEKEAYVEYEILKEHIAYAKLFIDTVINYCEKHNLECITGKELEFIRNNIIELNVGETEKEDKNSKNVMI